MRKLMGVALALCACGGVSYTSGTTKGRACSDAAEVICAKFSDCGFFPQSQHGACRGAFVDGCCTSDGTCREPVANPTGAADCVNRVPGEACAAFGTRQAPDIPAYCRAMF
jgi:hypothetical protein